MPIRIEEAYFVDPRLEREFRERIQFYESKLPTLPSHIEWFDIELFRPLIKELCLCEIELRAFDQKIQEDPLTFGKIDKIRNNTANRLRQLRVQLGIDASKIKVLTPQKKKPSSLIEALADEDYIE